MRITTIFFDLDDTLYPSRVGLWEMIKNRMNSYMSERLNIPLQEIPVLREKYYLQYGTTLLGLRRHHQVDMQDFLAYVHDIPLTEYLTPDPVQRAILLSLPTRNLIFTNADIHHAERVLQVLNLQDVFSAIIDINRVDPYCKPMLPSFAIAMQVAREIDPARCLMIDDLPRTTLAARQAGMSSILYGASVLNGEADAALSDWSRFPALLGGLL